MNINEKMKQIIKNEGRTQRWTVQEMNKQGMGLDLNDSKFSAIMTGKRALTADELLAFCAATGRSPEEFWERE